MMPSTTAKDENTDAVVLENYVYAEILSYTVSNTRDLAKLRLISRQWNESIIPFVLKSVGFVKTCYNTSDHSNGFIRQLVDVDEIVVPNRINLDDNIIPALFKEWAVIQRITCLNTTEEYHSYDVTVINSNSFPHLANELCETMSPSKFEQAGKEALDKGMFFSIQQFNEKRTNYGPEPSDEWEIHAVILTCRVKREECMMIDEGNIVILHGADVEGNSRVRPLDSKGDYRGYVTEDMENDEYITCLVPLIAEFEEDFMWGRLQDDTYLLDLSALLSANQEKMLVSEGVAIADGFVPELLHSKLMNQINNLANTTGIDYHPHSNNIVRDLVHPALYAYVDGISSKKTVPLMPPETFSEDNVFEETFESSEDMDDSSEGELSIKKDYWGRKYEASSKYQWLPTYFDISCDGTCTIQDYINNLLPRSNYESLYDSLAQLFSHALPLIESVFSYGRVVRERIRSEDEFESSCDDSSVLPIDEDYYSLRGRKLQVITKIVDYELSPGATYEGVWHVEGMSHEEIVATAIYFIHRDEDIKGGDVLFKRAFHQQEANLIFSTVMQSRPSHLERIIDDGILPLGRVETLPRRLLVFPNSHVHKVSEIKNVVNMDDHNASDSIQKRRIVVFFLVNPERRIISTREVPPQASEHGGEMSRQEALEHRLELMAERKYTKQDW
eukprot:CAMPEP_0178919038 /NCGR_PEP_ID=MMETSP0786-20121207/14189_1 /TAXON_ID=186022 /ORGANISM="Thalassionema frauenfeldii, Strain CCMP 1798" /LENGTH=671 /DNA_ID=CAMNT_0020592873 /DNA_START=19 /DNA_END=2031 /DNA_ORIENTATION=+